MGGGRRGKLRKEEKMMKLKKGKNRSEDDDEVW